MLDLRKPFFEELEKLMTKDKKVIFLTGDLGYPFIEPIQKRFPDRFYNCGCIEQSMINIACGLANSGWKPFVYSTINFLLFRPFEQIRNDICYQNINVKLIGARVSPFLGYSHNITEDEDLRLLCELPNIRVCLAENREDIKKAIKNNKPIYLRL